MKRWLRAGPALALAGLVGCAAPEPVEAPAIDTAGMEPQVRLRLETRQRAVVEDPGSGDAWGRLGMTCHAHDLHEEAAAAYRRAEELEPTEERWPYFLGDVLATLGEDPEGALAAFERFLALRPGYGPAHLRVGRVRVLLDQLEAAASSFERALALEPELVPARVGLGQVLLSLGRIEAAAGELEKVVEENPRHGQALAALGQAYLRLGRRDDARAIAEQARDAGRYVLYDDPLMSEVVAEGVSALAHWERARAYLDAGRYRQALAGLEMVAPLRPDDPSVHEQMALALTELGEADRARSHLERVVELDPSRAEARVQLVLGLLAADRIDDALRHLGVARERAPADPELRWLEGRALAAADRIREARTALEQGMELARADGRDVPAWVLTEWGSVLARFGDLEGALAAFERSLALEPRNARTLFSVGLALEALGRTAEAVAHYRRSMEVEPNPLAQGRLRVLGAL